MTTKRPAAPPPLTQRLQAELFATAAFPGPAPRPFIDWRDKWARIWAGVLAASAVMVASGLGMNAINVACQCQVFP